MMRAELPAGEGETGEKIGLCFWEVSLVKSTRPFSCPVVADVVFLLVIKSLRSFWSFVGFLLILSRSYSVASLSAVPEHLSGFIIHPVTDSTTVQ